LLGQTIDQAKFGVADGSAQLVERDILDLADTLASDGIVFSDPVQGLPGLVVEAESFDDHILLFVGEDEEHVVNDLFEVETLLLQNGQSGIGFLVLGRLRDEIHKSKGVIVLI